MSGAEVTFDVPKVPGMTAPMAPVSAPLSSAEGAAAPPPIERQNAVSFSTPSSGALQKMKDFVKSAIAKTGAKELWAAATPMQKNVAKGAAILIAFILVALISWGIYELATSGGGGGGGGGGDGAAAAAATTKSVPKAAAPKPTGPKSTGLQSAESNASETVEAGALAKLGSAVLGNKPPVHKLIATSLNGTTWRKSQSAGSSGIGRDEVGYVGTNGALKELKINIRAKDQRHGNHCSHFFIDIERDNVLVYRKKVGDAQLRNNEWHKLTFPGYNIAVRATDRVVIRRDAGWGCSVTIWDVNLDFLIQP